MLGLRLCSHLVPEGSTWVRFLLATYLNAPFFQVTTLEFGHCAHAWVQGTLSSGTKEGTYMYDDICVWTQRHFVLVPGHQCSGTNCEHNLSYVYEKLLTHNASWWEKIKL